eukprot:6545822-Prymnesium_polylepis.1
MIKRVTRESDQNYHWPCDQHYLCDLHYHLVCVPGCRPDVTSRVVCAGGQCALGTGVLGQGLYWHWECGVGANTGPTLGASST